MRENKIVLSSQHFVCLKVLWRWLDAKIYLRYEKIIYAKKINKFYNWHHMISIHMKVDIKVEEQTLTIKSRQRGTGGF